jgi:hypothetical protein
MESLLSWPVCPFLVQECNQPFARRVASRSRRDKPGRTITLHPPERACRKNGRWEGLCGSLLLLEINVKSVYSIHVGI